MLLTITTTHNPATDLGYLLHKNPERLHSFELSFGKAHLFYPEATSERCTAALLLDVDPVGLVRGKWGQQEGGTLFLIQAVAARSDKPFRHAKKRCPETGAPLITRSRTPVS